MKKITYESITCKYCHGDITPEEVAFNQLNHQDDDVCFDCIVADYNDGPNDDDGPEY